MGTVVVAAIVLVATTVLVLATNGRVGIDASVHHWVVHHSSPALRDASQVGKQPGTRWVYYACALAAALCGLWARRSVRAVVIAVAAVAIETVLLLAMKVAIGRGAPSSGTLALRVGGESFPSGHAANSLLALGLLGWWLAVGLGGTRASRRLAVALPLVVSGVTGVSMLLLDYHWLTDNVAGWAAGTLALCGAIWWDCRVPRPEWAQRRRARGARATGSQPAAGRGRLSPSPTSRDQGGPRARMVPSADGTKRRFPAIAGRVQTVLVETVPVSRTATPVRMSYPNTLLPPLGASTRSPTTAGSLPIPPVATQRRCPVCVSSARNTSDELSKPWKMIRPLEIAGVPRPPSDVRHLSAPVAGS